MAAGSLSYLATVGHRSLCSSCGVKKPNCDRPGCPCKDRVTPAQVFNWCVTRQSALGPGVQTCADALNTTTEEVKEAIRAWRNPSGHMELVRIRHGGVGWRIEAYYNTSGG